MNEELCIITSLNLYEFSQVNNNEIGILIRRSDDSELYRDAYEEAQRIIRVSEEVRISLERVMPDIGTQVRPPTDAVIEEERSPAKLTTSKLAAKLGLKTEELMAKLVSGGWFELRDAKHYLTAKGKAAGGEFRSGSRFGSYFLWPENFKP